MGILQIVFHLHLHSIDVFDFDDWQKSEDAHQATAKDPAGHQKWVAANKLEPVCNRPEDSQRKTDGENLSMKI